MKARDLEIIMLRGMDRAQKANKKPVQFLLGPNEYRVWRKSEYRHAFKDGDKEGMKEVLAGEVPFCELPVKPMRAEGVAVVTKRILN